jgi:hypothetical protein
MPDRFYGEVSFPEWACKYLPQDIITDVRLSVLPDDKVVCFEEEEANNGVPWIVADLEALGIPYDGSSSEYFEYKAETKYSRFRDGGKIDELVVTAGDELIQAVDIVAMIGEGKSLEDIRAWCQKTLDQIAPLTPPLEAITEQDYLEWVKSKARIFREHLWALRDEHQVQVGDMYLSIVPDLQAGVQSIYGLPGLLVTRPVAKGRLVANDRMDEGERLFPQRMFFKTDKSTVGAFFPFSAFPTDTMADAVMHATDYLEIITGNVDASAA